MDKYINKFFKHLQIYEDLHHRRKYKTAIMRAVAKFLARGDNDSAYSVYEAFFNAYWIGIQGGKNPFLGLTEKIKQYEENAGKLIDYQRDHYVHSVNVFLLGLSIYSENKKYQKYFNDYALNKSIYPDSYDTNDEEFFYRWGLASLFHDIGYPIEITLKQANKYFDFVWCYPEKNRSNRRSFIELPHFDKFIWLPKLKPSAKHSKEFYKKYPHIKLLPNNDSVSLLSEYLATRLGASAKSIKKGMELFIKSMRRDGFVDHGFYSAVIMSRWYYCLLKTTKWNPAYFYYAILDSASAILMHNYHKNVLMKKPFRFGPLKVSQHPIAYLLILSDEIQDWNRKAYGENDRPVCRKKIGLLVNDSELKISYKKRSANYIRNKSFVVDVKDVFVRGVKIT